MTIYDHWLYRFLTGPLNNVAWLYILLPCVFAGGIYLTVGSERCSSGASVTR